MMAGLVSGTGTTRAPLKQRGDDLYETPSVATEALLRAESLPHVIWEPACGRGAIARVLRSAGHLVVASDLVDYKTPYQDFARWDFLNESNAHGTGAIVTNPPFKLANEFVRHALRLSPLVIMLLRLAFLESDTKRNDLIDGGQLARVHVFRNRIPQMHRDSWTGPKRNSGMAFAWFVWDRAHTGPTELHRISWEAA